MRITKVFCEFCGETFKDISDATEHSRKVHLDRFQCLTCGKNGFNSTLLIYQHYVIFHGSKNKDIVRSDKYYCSKCGKLFTNITDHFDHVKFLHEDDNVLAKESKILQLIFCERCGVGLKSYIELYTHFRSQHPHGHECLICFKFGFKSTRNLNLHYTSDHCDEKVKEVQKLWSQSSSYSLRKLFYCIKCGKGFNNITEHLDHSNHTHADELFICCVCDFLALDYYVLVEHYVDHFSCSTSITCRLCNSFFKSTRSYDEHRREHTERILYPCNMCNFEKRKLRDVRRHWMFKHFDAFLHKLKCDFCDTMLNLDEYKSHQIKHTTKCEKCDKELCSAYLKQHIQESHSNDTILETSVILESSNIGSNKQKESSVTNVNEDIPVVVLAGTQVTSTSRTLSIEVQESSKKSQSLIDGSARNSIKVSDKVSENFKDTSAMEKIASDMADTKYESSQKLNKCDERSKLSQVPNSDVEVSENINVPTVDTPAENNIKLSDNDNASGDCRVISETETHTSDIPNTIDSNQTQNKCAGLSEGNIDVEIVQNINLPIVDTAAEKNINMSGSDKASENCRDITNTGNNANDVPNTIDSSQALNKKCEGRGDLSGLADSDVEILENINIPVVISDDEDLKKAESKLVGISNDNTSTPSNVKINLDSVEELKQTSSSEHISPYLSDSVPSESDTTKLPIDHVSSGKQQLSGANLDKETEVITGEKIAPVTVKIIPNESPNKSNIEGKPNDSDVEILENVCIPIVISDDDEAEKVLVNKPDTVIDKNKSSPASKTTKRQRRRNRKNKSLAKQSVSSRTCSKHLPDTASKNNDNCIASEENNNALITNSLKINTTCEAGSLDGVDKFSEETYDHKYAGIAKFFEEAYDHKYMPTKCNNCKKLFSNSNDLAMHLSISQRKHAKEKYACDKCGNPFLDLDKDEILIHVFLHEIRDNETGNHQCVFCDTVFNRKIDLARHAYKVHSMRPVRTIKNFDEFMTKEYKVFLQVEKGEIKEPVWCTHCDAYFEEKEGLISHKKSTTHGLLMKCKKCGYKGLKSTMESHLQFHKKKLMKPNPSSKNSNPPPSASVASATSPNACQNCKRLFMTQDDLKFHCLSYGPHDVQKYRCNICKRTYCTELLFIIHIREHEIMQNKRRTCAYCPRTFQIPSSLASHESRSHPYSLQAINLYFYISEEFKTLSNGEVNQKQLWCPECDSCFESPNLLMDHKQATKHGETKECKSCDVQFVNDEKYRIHQRLHLIKLSGRQNCLYCNITTTHQNYLALAEHEVRNHEYKLSSNKRTITEVVQNISEVGQNITEGCNEEVSTEYKPVTCNLCNRRYISDQDLKNHFLLIPARKHFLKKYVCNLCRYMCDKESKFRVHLAKHQIDTDSRRNCLYCNELFQTAHYLAYHEASCSPKPNIENLDSFLSDEFKLLEQISKGEYPQVYWCPQCNNHFEKIETLIHHKNVKKHDVLFKCNICNTLLQNQRELDIHIVHHDVVNSKRTKCEVCGIHIEDTLQLAHHEVSSHKNAQGNVSSTQLNVNQKSSGDRRTKITVPTKQLEVETKSGNWGGSDRSNKINSTGKKKEEVTASNKDTGEMKGEVPKLNKKVNPIEEDLLEEGEIVDDDTLATELSFETVNSSIQSIDDNSVTTELPGETNKYTRCIACPKQFLNEEDMLAHCKRNKKHKFAKYECNKCGKKFNTGIFFKIHMYNHDIVASGRTTCDLCKISFHKLAEHEYTVHNIKPKFDKHLDMFKSQELKVWEGQCLDNFIWCPYCEEHFDNEKELINHKTNTSHAPRYKCKTCLKSYNKKEKLERHVIEHDILKNKKASCAICSATYSHSWELARHQYYAHKNLDDSTKSKSDRRKDCDDNINNTKSKSSKKSKRDVSYKTKDRSSRRSDERNFVEKSVRKEKLNVPVALKERNHDTACGENSRTVIRNTDTNENTQTPPQLKYEIINSEAFCDCCMNRYASPSDAEIHIKLHPPPNNEYTCRICYVKCSTDLCLRKHLYAHILTGKNVTRCSRCHLRFNSIHAQVSHEYKNHSSRTEYITSMNIENVLKKLRDQMNIDMTQLFSKSYSCPFCNKTFPTKEHVLHHKDTSCLHVSCHICSAQLKGKAIYQIHMIQHDIITNGRTSCRECGLVITNTFTLATHEHSHDVLGTDQETGKTPGMEHPGPLQKRLRLTEDLTPPQPIQPLFVYNPLHQLSQPLVQSYVPNLIAQPNIQVPFVPPYAYPQKPYQISSPPVIPINRPYISENVSPSTSTILNNLHTFKQLLLANMNSHRNVQSDLVARRPSATIQEMSVTDDTLENRQDTIMPSSNNNTTEINVTQEIPVTDHNSANRPDTIVPSSNNTTESNEQQMTESQQEILTAQDVAPCRLSENLQSFVNTVAVESPNPESRKDLEKSVSTASQPDCTTDLQEKSSKESMTTTPVVSPQMVLTPDIEDSVSTVTVETSQPNLITELEESVSIVNIETSQPGSRTELEESVLIVDAETPESDLRTDLDESVCIVSAENPKSYLRLRQDLAIDPFKTSGETGTGKAKKKSDITLRCNPPRILFTNIPQANATSNLGQSKSKGWDPALGTSLEGVDVEKRNECKKSNELTKRKNMQETETKKRKQRCDKSPPRSSKKSKEDNGGSNSAAEIKKSKSNTETRSSRSKSEDKKRSHIEKSGSSKSSGKKEQPVMTEARSSTEITRKDKQKLNKQNFDSSHSKPGSSQSELNNLSMQMSMPVHVVASLNETISTEYPVITKPEEIDILDEKMLELLDDFESSSTALEVTNSVSDTIKEEDSYPTSTSTYDQSAGPALKECYACGKVFIKDVIDNHDCSGPF